MPRSRFPAEPQVIDGIAFPSKKEATRFALLRLRERAGEINNLTCHPKFKVEIRGRHLCTYTADFQYDDLIDGHPVIEEIKSSGTRKDPYYRLRRKAAELYHDIAVTEVVR